MNYIAILIDNLEENIYIFAYLFILHTYLSIYLFTHISVILLIRFSYLFIYIYIRILTRSAKMMKFIRKSDKLSISYLFSRRTYSF